MADKLTIHAPFAKSVATEDGGREVWGFVTLERVDKSGEIADFEGTVKAFEKWSNDTAVRTGGKNLGNVRLMHQPIAVGKTIHWEPSETTIDDVVYKGIWVGAYIPPTKPDVIRDIDEGILSGFSIGGSYAQKWYDSANKATRFIPIMAEYSLVDNSCVPGADIVDVIQKAAAGPWDHPERNLGKNAFIETVIVTKEHKEMMCPHCVKAIGEKELFHDGDNFFHSPCMKSGPIFFEKMDNQGNESFEEQTDRVQAACNERYRGPGGYWDGYVLRTFPDKVIIRDWDQDKYFEVPYEDKDGQITLGAPTEVVRIETYVPADTLKSIEAEELQKRQMPGGTNPNEKGGGEVKLTPEEIVKSILDEALRMAKGEEVGGREWEQQDRDTLNKAVELLESAMKQIEEVAKREQTEANTGDPNDQKDADMLKSVGEVLSKIVDEVKKVAAGEGSEDVNKAVIAAVGDALSKRGAAISKGRQAHLEHAKNHIDAALKGEAYTADDHAAFESQMKDNSPNGVEQETDASKTVFGDMRKMIGDEVAGALSKFEGLAKAEDFTKAFDAIQGVAKSVEGIHAMLESMEKRLKVIEEQPVQSGPFSNIDIISQVTKTMGQQSQENQEAVRKQVLTELVNNDELPLGVRQTIGKTLALGEHPMLKRQ